MSASLPASPRSSTADPAMRDGLMELASFGLRIARVAAGMAEADGRVVALLAAGLPDRMGTAAPLPDGVMAGLAVDAVDAALREAMPRVAVAGQVFERVSRAVRRTMALVKRIEAGWPRHGGSDDRRTMARRQIARGVGERIARHATGEAAERLFDDLAERLDGMEAAGEFAGDLDLPVGAVVAAICRAMGLPEPERDAAEARRMGGDGSVAGFRPDG